MIELQDDQLRKWREVFAKDGIVYETDEEYREAVSNLVGYFDVLIQIDLEQRQKTQTD